MERIAAGLLGIANHAYDILFSLGSQISLTSLACALAIAAAFLTPSPPAPARAYASEAPAARAVPAPHPAPPLDQGRHRLAAVQLLRLWRHLRHGRLSYQFLTNGVLNGLIATLGPVTPSALPELAQRAIVTVILFLAYEFGYWLDHFLKHRIPALWELHKVHHTAEVLTPVTSFRMHPLDTLVFGHILAATAALANGVARLLVRRHDLSIRAVGHEHHPGRVHPSLRAPAAHAHLDRLPRRARASFHQPGASPDSPLDQSGPLQQEPRQLPGDLGLAVRHAATSRRRRRSGCTYGVEPAIPDAHTISGEFLSPFGRLFGVLFGWLRRRPARKPAAQGAPQ